ncbi:hypothetical protein [Salisaeta longa]|uniref:hypothetical protein n=1 Tax=Salisaeta longa TaxID=503170 RepID=UPI0003B5EF98|nr:hypothetical protein [Salisaeta longa]
MSNIHYFQRYSQRENVITNNTLRLFAQIYSDSPSRLERLLEALVDGATIDVGVQMEQQSAETDSIPDGALTQSSFKIVIETKRSDSFRIDQLMRHAKALNDARQGILMLLLPEVPATKVKAAAEQIAEYDKSIQFEAVTFKQVIDVLIGSGKLIGDHEEHLFQLVGDYRNFCSGENLLPTDDLMRAVPCGTSHKDNFEYDLYYHPSSRGYQSHQYIGIYYKRSIRGIGKLAKTVETDLVDGELILQNGESLSADEEQRIRGAIEAGKKHGYSLDTDCEFLLVDTFHPTNFKKASSYGMMGPQYFSLRDYLDVEENEPLPDTETIAEQLREMSWE